MKSVTYLAVVLSLGLLLPYGAFARDKNQRSVDISDPVQIGGTNLKPGNYKVQWEGTGPTVQVKFLQSGKTVATAPAKLQMNDAQVLGDGLVTDGATDSTRTLREIDFAHQKEALVFTQSGM